MADKLRYIADTIDLTAIADAIRTKGGTSGQLVFPQGFEQAIAAIETGGIVVPFLEPVETDYIYGYVDTGGNFVKNTGVDNCRNDIYQVEQGKAYVIFLGPTVGDRFRASNTAFDPRDAATGTTVSGYGIYIASNPSAYAGCYVVSMNRTGYLTITKDVSYHDNIKTYLLDITEIINYTPAPTYEDLVEELFKDDGINKMLVEVDKNEDFWFLGDTSENQNLTIDWGDGTTSTTSASEAFGGEFRHRYSKSGFYLIKISPTTTWDGTNAKRFNANFSWGNEHGSNGKYTGTGFIQLIGLALGENYKFSGNLVYERPDLQYLCITSKSVKPTFDTYAFSKIYGLRKFVYYPPTTSGALSFPNYACDSSYALTEVSIPDSITTIPSYAFNNCYALEGITIPTSCIFVYGSSFKYCSNLKTIDLPESVQDIYSSAFESAGLTSLIIRRTSSLVSLGSNALKYTPIARQVGSTDLGYRIYVPDALINDYKAASNWSTYADYIVGLSTL